MAVKRKRYGSFAWTDKKTGYLYARVRVKLPNGKLKVIYKRAANVTHAEQLADEIRAEHETRGDAYLEGRIKTFKDLAEWYKNTYVVAPVYSAEGQKVSGMRSWEHERRKIDRLTEFFGSMNINKIDERTLTYFKKEREKQGLKTATVNRDLETLRAIFNKAKRRRWLVESPFDFGERLIEKALESRRTVILTDPQEKIILEKAKALPQSLIYYLILVLRDTGARPSEIYPVNERKNSGVSYEPVRWRNFFDYDFKAVKLTSCKGKQKKERFAPVTIRVKNALMELWYSLKDENRSLESFVFSSKSYKTSWKQVLKDSELSDIRLRDLRRDFRTRLARMGYSDQLAQRLLGHETESKMTYHYTEADLQAVYLANEMLDKQNDAAVIESDSADN